MTAQELIHKKIRLTRKFVQNMNTFKVDCIMRVRSYYGEHAAEPEGIILVDPRRPDIRLVLGPSEYKYCEIVHDEGRCFVCQKDVVSIDGKHCPDCGKPMWELVARQPKS